MTAPESVSPSERKSDFHKACARQFQEHGDWAAAERLTSEREAVEQGTLRATSHREARDAARAKAMHDAEVWPIDGPTWNLAYDAATLAALSRPASPDFKEDLCERCEGRAWVSNSKLSDAPPIRIERCSACNASRKRVIQPSALSCRA